jgi:hypothetical protein
MPSGLDLAELTEICDALLSCRLHGLQLLPPSPAFFWLLLLCQPCLRLCVPTTLCRSHSWPQLLRQATTQLRCLRRGSSRCYLLRPILLLSRLLSACPVIIAVTAAAHSCDGLLLATTNLPAPNIRQTLAAQRKRRARRSRQRCRLAASVGAVSRAKMHNASSHQRS